MPIFDSGQYVLYTGMKITPAAASPPSPRQTSLNWSAEERLRFIDAALFWNDRINRSDLMGHFGISVPQASADLKRYQSLAPHNIRYDGRAKSYMATQDFSPLFELASADGWPFGGPDIARSGLNIDVVPSPARTLEPWLVRRVVRAIRRALALRVLYQDMISPQPEWKWIAPSAFGSDGVRWHVRAWNIEKRRYEDLLFPRIFEIDGEQPREDLPPDEAWERFVTIRLRPAQRLNPPQRMVIERDYGMEHGVATIEVRAALLFLFLWRNRLDRSDRRSLVEVVNMNEVNAELKKINQAFAPNNP
jgi:hypothetical protein